MFWLILRGGFAVPYSSNMCYVIVEGYGMHGDPCKLQIGSVSRVTTGVGL